MAITSIVPAKARSVAIPAPTISPPIPAVPTSRAPSPIAKAATAAVTRAMAPTAAYNFPVSIDPSFSRDAAIIRTPIVMMSNESAPRSICPLSRSENKEITRATAPITILKANATFIIPSELPRALRTVNAPAITRTPAVIITKLAAADIIAFASNFV